MPSQVTVTAPTGPAQLVTAAVLTNLTEMHAYAAPKSMLQVMVNGRIREFDINATTTYTITISAGVMTVVVSQ